MIEGTLILDGVEVDIADDTVFPFTYSEADIREPEKRKRNFSKTP